jgi:hypothetical protein
MQRQKEDEYSSQFHNFHRFGHKPALPPAVNTCGILLICNSMKQPVTKSSNLHNFVTVWLNE